MKILKNNDKFSSGKAGLYVHIPFCRKKCIYCDFYSVGERKADWTKYIDAVLKEWKDRRHEFPGTGEVTIYIGGGTPSLIPAADFIRLAEHLKEPLVEAGINISEFTVEVNPDDVSEEKAAVWKMAGVDRISMGVQSLNDTELKLIGRRHDSACAVKAYHILRNHFSNISLDIMFGLPGQTLESLGETVRGMIALRPEHLSAYSLMYEERTAITRLRDMGMVEEISEESSVEMFRLISGMFSDAGYKRYEISNYSLPGCRAIHNSNYWQGFPYVGLGPGAHSYDGERVRKWNIPDVWKYIESVNKGEYESVAESEILGMDELREEMIMTRLRTAEGLDTEEFGSRFGTTSCRTFMNKAEKYISTGFMEKEDAFIRLTDKGVMISDDIMSDLF